jgi:hypothetical protein
MKWMFDPTVYENLKVVIEGAIYDLDFEEYINITDRKDIIDLATFSRTYKLQFTKNDAKKVKAEFLLHANLQSFTDEIINHNEHVGCELTISFIVEIRNLDICEKISSVLYEIWEGRPMIEQKVSFVYPRLQKKFKNHITIKFNRQITEAQIDDIQSLLNYTLRSAEEINEICRNGLK